MRFLRKIVYMVAAALLVLSGTGGMTVGAAEAYTEVYVPVETKWAQGIASSTVDNSVLSEFTLIPVGSAPAMQTSSLTLKGQAKGQFGPIRIEVPGDYYYTLTGKVGLEHKVVDMTVRISVTTSQSGLNAVVTAYKNQQDAQNDQGKSDLVFEVRPKKTTTDDPGDDSSNDSSSSSSSSKPGSNKPGSKKPDKNKGANTASASNLFYWSLLGLGALILFACSLRESAKK